MKLRGYAIPWNRPAVVAGVTETIAPGAVRIDSACNIKLQMLTHNEEAKPLASTARKTLRLFHDDYGLGFEADMNDIAPTVFGRDEVAALANGADQCSVYFSLPWTSTDDVERQTRTIKNARIQHITIAANCIYGDDTAAWLADESDERPGDEQYLPRRVRALARQWNTSRHITAADIIAQRKPVVPPASLARPVNREVHRPGVFASVDRAQDVSAWAAWWSSEGRILAQAKRRSI